MLRKCLLSVGRFRGEPSTHLGISLKTLPDFEKVLGKLCLGQWLSIDADTLADSTQVR